VFIKLLASITNDINQSPILRTYHYRNNNENNNNNNKKPNPEYTVFCWSLYGFFSLSLGTKESNKK